VAKFVIYYDADGATVITGKTLVKLLAGATGTGQKFGLKNVGDVDLGIAASMPAVQIALSAVLGNDGFDQSRIIADPDTISPPWGLTAPVTAGGGAFAGTGTFGYVVVAKKSTGRTIASTEVTATVTVVTQTVTVNWIAVTGATGYLVYRTATPGTYGATTLIADIGSGATITFADTGAAATSGTPSLENTTGGVGPTYGTPPGGLNTATAAFLLGQAAGTLKVGESDFFWFNRVIPANASAVGNRRKVDFAVTEGA
jgi:hypothetical protein